MGTKLLIAAGEAAATKEDIPGSVQALIDAADEILVIAPSLPGRFEWLVSATDKAREQADERLRTILGQLDEMGADARGEVGADDPLTAFDDAIRQFAPDHLLIAIRTGDHADWQERGLLDQLLERFPMPMTVFQLA